MTSIIFKARDEPQQRWFIAALIRFPINQAPTLRPAQATRRRTT
ncbi:MAG TPA: hypothetical protein VML91_22025 [Burkholderiales bacterium]|nr:hypothetical protein [Burkholderiales bacterium]